MATLIRPSEASSRSSPPRFALFELGFRPFYLGGAAWAVVSIALWLATLLGWPVLRAIDIEWHAHEMIFGFAAAIITGFAFTAVRNWTGQPTPTGASLALLFMLWCVGRLALLGTPSLVGATLDLLFLPAVAFSVAAPIVRVRQLRNLFLPGLLLLLAVLNVGYHASRLQLCTASMLDVLVPALYLVTFLASVIAGRVIPGFTGNVIGRKLPRGDNLDRAALALTAIGLVLATSGAALASIACGALIVAAGLQLVRWVRWQGWRTARVPILFVLHAAYLWIPIGLALLAGAVVGVAPLAAAAHAFGIGATGGLVLAMMTRSARGHTARPLVAGGLEQGAYGFIALAAAARLLAAFGFFSLPLLFLTALAWIGAFFLFLARFAPWLVQPRLDGMRG